MNAPLRAPVRRPACARCGELVSLLAELRDAQHTLVAGVALGVGIRRALRERASQAAAGRATYALVDIRSEQLVLADALTRGGFVGVTHEDFGMPLHRAHALAIEYGVLDAQTLGWHATMYRGTLFRLAARWYRSDGGRAVRVAAAPTDLVDALLRVDALARQRRALALVEESLGALRRADCEPHMTAATLRGAAELLA